MSTRDRKEYQHNYYVAHKDELKIKRRAYANNYYKAHRQTILIKKRKNKSLKDKLMLILLQIKKKVVSL